MSLSPLVSVVLPCFDAERFLPEALNSLLGQTYGHLEIIAIDDGSRDATPGILEESAARDERVRILRNGTNLGLIRTLNRGVAEARGEFIARMDADDISAPHRIDRQVEALALRPEIGVVATGVEPINEEGHAVGRPVRPRSLEPGAARFMALFATPLVHPTLLARASVMQTHSYGASDDSLHTEDYELFTRMLATGVEILNLDEPLVAYRVGSEGVSRRHETIQVDNFVACARRHLERTLGLRPKPGAHRVLVNRIDRAVTARDLGEGLRCLDRIEEAFMAREPRSALEIAGIADEQRVDILVQAALKGTTAVRLAAVGLTLRYGRRLLSPRARRYLGAKYQRGGRPSR
jgi:glycosyltransferase involved in cell wall biosynthesis